MFVFFFSASTDNLIITRRKSAGLGTHFDFGPSGMIDWTVHVCGFFGGNLVLLLNPLADVVCVPGKRN